MLEAGRKKKNHLHLNETGCRMTGMTTEKKRKKKSKEMSEKSGCDRKEVGKKKRI